MVQATASIFGRDTRPLRLLRGDFGDGSNQRGRAAFGRRTSPNRDSSPAQHHAGRFQFGGVVGDAKSERLQREPGATRLAAMAKRLATDTGFEVVNGCLQLHGGYGYLRDHPIERVLRDVRVHQILEGTNEVMRLIVSRDILGN